MNKAKIIITVFLFWSTFSCLIAQELEERNLPEFSAIDVSQGIEVYVSEGGTQKVSIEADEDMLSSVITEVRDGTLKMSINDKYKRLKFNKLSVRVNVTLPKLSALHVAGRSIVVGITEFETEDLSITISSSSDVRFEKKMTVNTLNVNVNNNGRLISKTRSTADKAFITAASQGEIYLNLDVQDNIECSGATQGKISMSGKAPEALLSGTSHSEIKMKAFEVQNANVVATTAASIGITVKEFLAATATYGASINYWGKPKSVNKEATSGGKIR